jgi:hypothetical protein
VHGHADMLNIAQKEPQRTPRPLEKCYAGSPSP